MKRMIMVAITAMAFGHAQAAVVHSAAGASANVSSNYVAQFQALVTDLEAHGATIKFMGGIRPGRCGQSSKHPCGMALDVCQLRRGVVDSRCHLPGPTTMSQIASRHGLFSGGDWCNSDYGHVEAGGSTACGHRWARGATTHEARTYRGDDGGHAGGHASARVEASAGSGGPGSLNFH